MCVCVQVWTRCSWGFAWQWWSSGSASQPPVCKLILDYNATIHVHNAAAAAGAADDDADDTDAVDDDNNNDDDEEEEEEEEDDDNHHHHHRRRRRRRRRRRHWILVQHPVSEEFVALYKYITNILN